MSFSRQHCRSPEMERWPSHLAGLHSCQSMSAIVDSGTTIHQPSMDQATKPNWADRPRCRLPPFVVVNIDGRTKLLNIKQSWKVVNYWNLTPVIPHYNQRNHCASSSAEGGTDCYVVERCLYMVQRWLHNCHRICSCETPLLGIGTFHDFDKTNMVLGVKYNSGSHLALASHALRLFIFLLTMVLQQGDFCPQHKYMFV